MVAAGGHTILGLGVAPPEGIERLRARGVEYLRLPGREALLAAIRGGGADLVLVEELADLGPVLQAIQADEPLLVAIHSAEASVRRQGLDSGADAAISPLLDPEEWIAQVGALLRLREKGKRLAESKRELERLSVTDDLTGLHNKRWLLARLAEEISRVDRYRDGLALILLDLDHFKRINDARGHLFGDKVLMAFSDLLRSGFRNVDRVARYGGEEFAVILPETGLEGGRDAAERFRQQVEGTTLAGVALTVSAGVAAHSHGDEGDVQSLLRQADEALYLAKRSGRNRVIAVERLPPAKLATP